MRSSSNANTIRLAGSELEVDKLKERFPEGSFFLGKQVTEERFKKMASSFDILHLAVHGLGDTEKNYSASLLFRDTVSSSGDDGKLNWYEMFDMNLKARLAVIASCESGIGKVYRGEGMLSMANAFAYAGCSNIVMGLWKVNDQVSVSLMDSFYDKIKNGDRVDNALTYAKRNYLENSDDFSANPKMWASMVTYGNGQVIEKSWPLIYWIVIAIFIITILFFAGRRFSVRSKNS